MALSPSLTAVPNARCEKLARLPPSKQWEEVCPSWCMQYEEQRQNGRLATGQGFLVFPCLTQCISLMSQVYIWAGLICLGVQMGSPVILPMWNTEWLFSGFYWFYLLLIVFYTVLIQASEVLGMDSALDKLVFGSLLSKSWPNACWTRHVAEGFAGCSPCLEVTNPGAALYSWCLLFRKTGYLCKEEQPW